MKQVLDFYQRKNQSAQARDFLTDLVARAPKQDAARTALDAMKGATANPASALLPTKTPPIKLAAASTPTPEPSATPTSKPATQPVAAAIASVIAPRKVVKQSHVAVKTPMVSTQPTP